MFFDDAAEWLAGDQPWPDHNGNASRRIVAAMLAHCAPPHLLEATPLELAFALVQAPRHGFVRNMRLHGKRASPVAAAAGALAYGLIMLEQSTPRAWEACRLALASLLAATADRPPCAARAQYDRQLFGNARRILDETGDREPDTAAWADTLPAIRQRLADKLTDALRPRAS